MMKVKIAPRHLLVPVAFRRVPFDCVEDFMRSRFIPGDADPNGEFGA